MGELGVVVVGLGRAGQARVRDIALLPGVGLQGTVSRRPGAGTLALSEAVAREDIDLAVIATENASHASLAQAFLRAGKHVLVDFPLATDAATARELYGIAQARGLCLHTELIGLLTSDHAAVIAACRASPPARISLHFTGAVQGWLQDEVRAGRWGNLAVARLHTLWDLAGPLVLREARLHATADAYVLDVTLHGAADCVLHLREERGPSLPRSHALTVTGRDGSRLPPQVPAPPSGLFLRDLQACVARIRSQGSQGAYVDDATVLAVLELGDAISAAVLQPTR